MSKERSQWHHKYKQFVFDYFNGVCQGCKNKVSAKWAIHHKTYNYKGEHKLYETPALELIEKDIITLLCRKCHIETHTAKNADSPIHNAHTLENTGYCKDCGKREHGIFGRQSSENLPRLLCKKCFTIFRKLHLIEACDLCGIKGYGMSARGKSMNISTKLCPSCLHNYKLHHIEQFEECELCGRLEKNIGKRKSENALDKNVCSWCFPKYKMGIIQTSLFS